MFGNGAELRGKKTQPGARNFAKCFWSDLINLWHADAEGRQEKGA